MMAGVGKAGDYAGQPLLTVNTHTIVWNNPAKTQINANWTLTPPVDATAHWIMYKTGVVMARIVAPLTYNFSSISPAGVVPKLAAVAVPANCDTGGYDPLAADPLAYNLYNLIAAYFLFDPKTRLDAGQLVDLRTKNLRLEQNKNVEISL